MENANVNEIVICSAIKCVDGSIIRGHRHVDCFNAARVRDIEVKGRVEGFITSKNRFVDRKEGYLIQYYAGIESANPRGYDTSGELYSEDLY